ncbi:MAG: glycosyltransferase family 92 protein [Rhodobacter sp.]|nr:glycosyltransferase family 92 protein [Rhodobacter sp.]MCA3493152.1 glycosyltransferase family 92 protein [Rhodobacter sp.]MCA3498668.1 glycosyltransferase family 92 protein [Rhodobacter sp.]MCA3503408.1 glycosyltransferase family 92 protein [Rhodobacter sp.]MCA3518035.1 glycosyltransferase family 92 protein [Rhodobacter sp.]
MPFQLGILAIMKNEGRNIEEWIEHYIWQGVQQIYLIDNGSDDNTQELIKPWVMSGAVKVITLTERWKQEQHYWTAFQHFKIRSQCKWLIMADLDEFWFCKDGRILSQAVEAYDKYHVIYANWTMFGSAGHDRHPESLRMCLTRRSPDLGPHDCTKYICRTRAISTRRKFGIHKLFGTCSSRTISDNGLLQINHYPLQSREYFQDVKMRRGDAFNPSMDQFRDWEYFEAYDSPCVVEDTLLRDQVRQRKQLLMS